LAKKSDHLADSYDADDSGGVLSGLLAEEDELDRRALWRIGSWGAGATGAVILAVMANQSSLGLKRDQVAAADLTRQAQQIQSVARETQNEARRLAAAIDTLNGDRDRLYSRVTSLELGLESATGAIARQGSAQAPQATTTEPHTAESPPAPAVAPVGTTQAAPVSDKPAASTTEPAPATVSSVARSAAKTDIAKSDAARIETARAEAAKTEAAKAEAAKTEAAKTEAAKTEAAARTEAAKAEAAKAEAAKTEMAKPDSGKADTARPEAAKASPATPLMAAQSIVAPPDPAAGKLIEPSKALNGIIASPIPEIVASAPSTSDDDDESSAPKVALQRTEFGVDVGSANSVNGLRALWRGLLKSRSNAPLTTLRPIIVVKEGTNGLGMQLRLVAGPLNDAGTAAKICAVLTENKRPCETAIFDGQRLSLGPDDAPPAAAKQSPRRRGLAKRAAVVVEEPKKPPETSTTLTSFFNRKNSQ